MTVSDVAPEGTVQVPWVLSRYPKDVVEEGCRGLVKEGGLEKPELGRVELPRAMETPPMALLPASVTVTVS